METNRSIEVTCPDCRGPLSVESVEGLAEVRCLVGHRFSPHALLQAHSEVQEKSLWSAAVALKETAALVEAIADRLTPEHVERLRAQAKKKQVQAAILGSIIQDLDPFEL